ncbi:MAG: diversity-generating retroelement protein Avd [Candidatus Eisenbacteria bacterium]|nr:diversity-generating retroelement protein Avd [Candidatus Eisenbacteria bacterium]
MAEVMTVIPKTYDLLVWILPVLAKFPRDQKFLLGDRLQTGLMDLLGLLIEANYTCDRTQLLRRANIELEKFRFLCRLASDMKYFGRDRYYALAERVDEIGRMIGGWMAAQPGQRRETT